MSKDRCLWYRLLVHLGLFAFLTSGLQTVSNLSPKKPPRYFRLHRDTNTGQLELQTAMVSFRTRNETQIDLYSLVHIADEGYYQNLKQDLELAGYAIN